MDPLPLRKKMSDEALLDMLRQGHGWALEEIFARYNLKLIQVATGVLRDNDLAKDVVQNVFMDLWARRTFCEIRGLPHYLKRAIRFQVLNVLRNGKLQEHHLRTIRGVQFANQTEDLLRFQELENLLQNSVQELPPRCKEVFSLSRFDNLSHKEISIRLNISTKTVEVQINKALSLLRTRIGKIVCLLLLNYPF